MKLVYSLNKAMISYCVALYTVSLALFFVLNFETVVCIMPDQQIRQLNDTLF